MAKDADYIVEEIFEALKYSLLPSFVNTFTKDSFEYRILRSIISRFENECRLDQLEKHFGVRLKIQKEFRTENAAVVKQQSYDKYFLLNGKKMRIENFNLQDATVKKGTAAELKSIFGKSMKNRLVSRVVLNKFIAEVA